MGRVIPVIWVLAAVMGLAGPVAASSVEDAALFKHHGAAPSWDVTAARGETRVVEFETDEGTWMSVDISPDGRWLVFDLLGHVYRMPAGGGTARALTQDSGVALNYHPRISPDGKRIAFVSDRGGQSNLWIMNADGSDARQVFDDPVTRITSPAWLPDGSAIVAVREFPTYSLHRRSARLWLFPVDSAAEAPRELVGVPSGTQAYWPAPSPDGRYIYYMFSTFAEPLHGLQRNQHIRRLELTGGAVQLVTSSTYEREYREGTNNEIAPQVSPDGRYLAFIRRIPGGVTKWRGHTLNDRNGLWLLDLESGEERLLDVPVAYDMQGAHGMKNLRIVPGYAWAPDSRSLVMWADGGFQRVSTTGDVERIPFSATVKREVSGQIRAGGGIDTETFTSSNLRWPAVSDKHDMLVFEAIGEIWRASLQGDEVTATPLVPWDQKQSYFMPDLAPDGESLAFIGWNDENLATVYRCRLPDCTPRKISDSKAVYRYPTWDDTGKTVFAFRSRQSDPTHIASGGVMYYDLVALSGREETVVRENLSPAPLSRGPEGRLYYLAREGDVAVQSYLALGKTIPVPRSVLYSLDPAEADTPRPHVALPEAGVAVPSPDGKRVAFIENYELNVGPMYRGEPAYVRGEANHWEGDDVPQALIRENPAHDVEQLSEGGAHHPRWMDDGRLLYSIGRDIVMVDADSGEQRRIRVTARVQRPVAGDGRSVALTGARILPMTEGDPVIENGSVVVRGGRITCVGQCDTAGADKVMKVNGSTIMPGFIDVHAHGGFLGGEETAIFPRHRSPQSLYLAHGVTTTLDPSVWSEGFFPVAELIAAGRMAGPWSWSTGEVLLPVAPDTGPVDEAQAEALVQRLADYGARSIKVYLTPRRDQRQMLAEAARKRGLSVTNEGADLYYNVGSVLDGHTGFEHPMHYLKLYRDAAEFFGRAGAVYSPTLTVAGAGRWAEEFYQTRSDFWADKRLRRFLTWQELVLHRNPAVSPLEEFTFPFMAEGVKDVRRAGGHGTLGGHGELWGLDTIWEMWTYAFAADPMEVLAMATRDGAYMLGLEHELGALQSGMIADLVVLAENPLEDPRHTASVTHVMQGGLLYEVPSLDRIWPDELPYGRPPWLEEDFAPLPE